jgi:hypothetical protein
MGYRGIVRGKTIELDEPLPYAEGTRVDVSIQLEKGLRKGSPEAVLQLAGTLTHEEAELIRQAVSEIRKIDKELWEPK